MFELFAAQEEALATPLVDYLTAKQGVRLIGLPTGDREKRMPTISFSMEGRKSADIVKALAAREFAAGHGHFYGRRCVEALGISADPGVIRVSMVHYNTAQEVDRLIATLDEVI